jgi:DNA-binding GntR family transcriptional regulator
VLRDDVDVLQELGRDGTRPDRASTAERVADVLRDRISAGSFPPGTRLSEDRITAALGVSRNTLREAFRLLAHDRLVVHELNRGVFVRRLTAADLVDLYRVRRVVEAASLRLPAPDLTRVAAAVEQGERAAAAEDWAAVATADLRFHCELAALARSRRLDELMRRVTAELRLAFHVMDGAAAFHEPYLRRNRTILRLLETGRNEEAEQELHSYLDEAERQLLAAFQEVAYQDHPKPV